MVVRRIYHKVQQEGNSRMKRADAQQHVCTVDQRSAEPDASRGLQGHVGGSRVTPCHCEIYILNIILY